MRRLYQLILKFHAVLLFFLFQFIAIGLLINSNSYHYSSFFSSSNKMMASVLKTRNQIIDYFQYGQINKDLAEEMAELKNLERSSFKRVGKSEFFTVNDTLFMQKWNYHSAEVVNKSVNRLSNSLTLDKGTSHGIKEDMGVVFNNKIVGIVKKVSDNFSVVLPVINENFRTSVKHKKSKDFGTLENWNGVDPNYGFVYGIPTTVNMNVGDSIITSGLSVYFPENILVGTVAEIDKTDAADSYVLKIKLSTNYYALNYVQIVDNIMKIEQLELEQNFDQDDS